MIENSNYEKLLDLLKRSKFKNTYRQFQVGIPPETLYTDVYTKFPVEGLTWDVSDYIGKYFCPELRLHGQIMNYLFAEITKEGGHTCAAIPTLFDNFKLRTNQPKLDKEKFKEALRELVGMGSVHIKGSLIWHNFWYQCEDKIVYGLLEATSTGRKDLNDPSAFRGNLTDKQFEILKSVQKNRVVIVDGLPGTGKTTSANKVVEYLRSNGCNVNLLAPTALAARNLSQKCGGDIPGKTIHSYVLRNREVVGNQAFIIDEFSMVETRIFCRFLEVISNCDATIVFMGDVGQLPSIGAGQLFKDLITQKDKLGIAYHHLNEIIRQEHTSEIVTNSHIIRRGETNILNEGQFIFKEQGDISASESIIKVAQKLKETGRDFAVLSPTHKGICGVQYLNEHLKEIFNPLSNDKKETSDGVWREGDRILVNHNFYDVGLVNGDIGHIEKINADDSFVLNIADQNYLVHKNVIEHLKLAYGITIHKSQGSEFDYILMPFVNSFSIQLQRKLLYTGVTRAKKQVYMFGEKSALYKAITSSREDFRRTGIAMLVDIQSKLFVKKESLEETNGV